MKEKTSTHRLGLALSGGGFRATLYHLGVVRFLRDAGILPNITHINTVSGGSILGAHLTLNWDRYCGTPEQFDEAAGEVIRVVQLDVRNRIVRRFPFASLVNAGRSVLRLGTARQLTRPGLLEKHYEQFLYGDVPLSQLPESPRLHILATNLSEGCLCSFNRDGLLLQRRVRGRRDRFERIQMGLATVPMAVAASSAFPGFFPPLELSGWEVGANEGEFNRQTFTDGGVYDNLGLRMFRCLEQSWVRDATPLRRSDFCELDDVTIALRTASSLPEGTPIRRLREKLDAYDFDHVLQNESSTPEELSATIVRGLWEVIRSDRLYRESCFQSMELADVGAQSLLNQLVQSGAEPDLENRLWVNRQIIESALRQIIGKQCLKLNHQGFDSLLVSDAGGKFKATRDVRRGGLISTALRSSDILMDRVWQLELEASTDTAGVLFIPISDVVDRAHDRWALDAEVQRQTSHIRTDIDRFSCLEISALVQHGYCVARNACRNRPELLNGAIPSDAPWDPISESNPEKILAPPPSVEGAKESPDLQIARNLRNSSRRRIWSTLLNLRDWPTYAWIVLVACLAISLPYYVLKVRERAQQQRMVLTAVADMSPDYRKILDLLDQNEPSQISGLPYQEVDSLESPDFTGFEVLSDTRVFDLRGWADQSGATPAVAFARLTVERTADSVKNTHLRIQRQNTDKEGRIYSPSERLNPTLSRMTDPDGGYVWELDFDFTRVPIGGRADVMLHKELTAETASSVAGEGRFRFAILDKTSLLEVWMLLPKGRYCDSFEVIGHPLGKPELAKVVVPHSRVQLALGSIATFRLLNPDAPFQYECVWNWTEKAPKN